MERVNKSCILCGGREWEPLVEQGEWRVFRCKGCGLGVLDPRPDKLELGALYKTDYLEGLYGEGVQIDSPGIKKRLSQETHRIRFFRQLKKGGRLLDIGCGMGYFLAACRNWGYDVEGMDISEDSTAYVRDYLKIPLAIGTVGEIDYPPGSFDIITMWHFLEHSPDPRQYLKKANTWLKPDGVLVVDVPNYTSTDARAEWQQWLGWHLPFHLYHFTPKTLSGLLEKQGFLVIRSKSYLSGYVKERLERLLIPQPISRIIARFYSGHSYAVAAKKNSRRVRRFHEG